MIYSLIFVNVALKNLLLLRSHLPEWAEVNVHPFAIYFRGCWIPRNLSNWFTGLVNIASRKFLC